MKWNEKFLEAKQSENTVYLFRFGWKRKIRSEMKRKNNKFFSRERAKRMRNGSRFASFRFEAKNFLKRNRRTLDPADGIKKYFVIKQLCRRHRWYFSFNAFGDSVTAFNDSTASAVSQAPLMLNQIPLMQLQKSLKNLWCLRHCCCRIRKVSDSADTNKTTLIPAVYCESLVLLFKGNYFEKNVYYKYGSQQL